MNQRPAHAAGFKGRAKNIPAEPAILLPYQNRWVLDKNILKLMEKSRRIGISYGTAYRVVRKHSTKDQRNDTWVSSRDEPTARLFIQDCKIFTKLLGIGAEDLGMKLIEKEKLYSLTFANGTEVNSLASNPDVFAGKGGDVVLDEFALRSDPRAVYAIANPTIDWGGSLEIISTHRGSHNYFNELIQEILHKGNPKRFSHHRVTLQDALDQGFLWKLQTKLREGDPRLDMDEADYFDYQRSKAPDEESFLQEYMCQPSDDNSAFLSYDLISTCTLRHPDNLSVDTEETVDFAGRKGRIRRLTNSLFNDIYSLSIPLYLGVDIGRHHDLTVLWLIGKFGGVYLPLTIIEMDKVEFDRQEAELYKLLRLPHLIRSCIDATGFGIQFAERAQKKYGKYKVEAVTFSPAVKESLAYPVRAAFEDRSTAIPDDELVIADLRAIKKETTSAGNIRFTSDRGKNGHSDRFWALALAHHAAATELNCDIPDVASRGKRHSEQITENFMGRIGSLMRKFTSNY